MRDGELQRSFDLVLSHNFAQLPGALGIFASPALK